MLNEPPPRKQHPLEQRPAPRPIPASPEGAPRQQVILHIPTVKPYVTYVLLAVIIGVFLLRALSPELDEQLVLWGANNAERVLRGGEYLRLYTSVFLHASIFGPLGELALGNSLHLVFNAYLLYVIGTSVEPFFGHLRFKLIFSLGGIAGSILSVVFASPNSYSLGASGAVFALIGAEAIYTYRHRRLLGARGQMRLQWLVTLGIMNLVLGVLSGFGTNMRIDNWGHVGGLIGGVILAWFIAPDYIPQRHPTIENELTAIDINPLKNRYTALSLYVTGLLAVLVVATLLAR